MKAIKFLAVFCFVLLNGWQVFGQIPEAPKPLDSRASEPSDKNKIGDEIKQLTAKDESEENYRIGFQDALEIRVARHEELTQRVRVNSNGKILLPRINQPISAICRTEMELKTDIETLYKSYLKNPFVSVNVIEYRSQSAGIFGAVEKPGSFNLNRKMRLLELLSYAGGPKVEKAGSKIQIARVGNSTVCAENAPIADEDDRVAFISYKLNDVVKGNINPWIQPGDIVTVLEVEEAYVVGDVTEPTKVPLRETVTLSQAIAYAGGVKAEAKKSKVKIQRQEANSPLRTEMIFDLNEINAKRIPDPVLQPNDIVEVPKDGIKSVRNGILKAISGGVGGLFMRF